MNKLNISNESTYKFEYSNLFRKIFRLVLKAEGIKEDSIANLIIINNKKMQEISKEYKKVDKPTDVLSFPADWEELYPILRVNELGDIFISYEKIKSQAKEYNHSEKREWAYIFTHGIYHLLGYDHIEKDEEKVMNKKVEDIMKVIKVGRDA